MPKTISLSVELRDAFKRAIVQHTGLVIREQDQDAFIKKLSIRMEALKLPCPQDYYLLLESNTKDSDREWQNLVSLITNNESYFFRDKEQLKLLQDRLLPELIKRKQADKIIRICSAGCSTGEEPYSLAILLKEILPNSQQWNLNILGIDINNVALNAARKGVYSPWSFRGVNESIKQRYFRQVNRDYHLDLEIKNMVGFQAINLVKDPFPFQEIDLFICRNVFIYFNSSAIAKVLDKMYHALHPFGYLLTGHAELSEQDLSRFHKKVFSQSLVYQRRAENSTEQESDQLSAISHQQSAISAQSSAISDRLIPQLKQATMIERSVTSDRSWQNTNPVSHLSKSQNAPLQTTGEERVELAENLAKQERYDAAIEQVKKVLQTDPNHFKASYLLAQIYANKGQYEEAIFYCDRALQIDSFAIDPHYLLAHIAEEKGNTGEAKRLLKQIIYLEPASVFAYLDLSHIYEKEGDNTRAVKMHEAALNILKQLSPDTQIQERENITVAELILKLETRNLQ